MFTQENEKREEKMKRVFSIVVIAAFLAAPMLAAAQQAQPAAPAAPAPAAAPAKPAEPAKVTKAQAEKTGTTVTGTVVELKNSKGKVSGHGIQTDTETYRVKADKAGKQLAGMVGKKVEATGTVAPLKPKYAKTKGIAPREPLKELTVKQIKEVM